MRVPLTSYCRVGSSWTHFDVGLCDGANGLEELLQIAFRDVVVQIFDGEFARGLDVVDLRLVLREEHGRAGGSVARTSACSAIGLVPVMLP